MALIELDRGQFVTSLRKLSERWGWSRDTVRRFLTLLQSDGMIEVFCDTTKTVVTVANWDKLQAREEKVRHECDTSATRIDTIKNNKNYKNDKKEEYESDIWSPGFNEFWSAYPKKVGKGAAHKSWVKLKPSADLHRKILVAIANAKESEQWQRDEGRYIPNPATWLNQSRWEDELTKKGGNHNAIDGGDTGSVPSRKPQYGTIL